MVNLDDVTVFNDIRERLAAVTPEQIEAAARKISKQEPPNAKDIIGAITSPSTRALWALFIAMRAEEGMLLAQAEAAPDAQIEGELKQRAALVEFLSDVAKEMFWAQAKIDCGYYEIGSVSLRGDWLLTKLANGTSTYEAFVSMMRGGQQ